MLRKLASLTAVLGRDPREFADRVAAIAQGRLQSLRARPAYAPVVWPHFAAALDGVLGGRFTAAMAEPELARIEADVRQRATSLRGGPIDDRHNADPLLARCCYAIARAMRPRVVVETGVAHGVTTAYVLAALDANAHGELHSIDMPPHDAGADARVGACVPEPLRARWQLHRGFSRRVLPGLMSELGGVDMFVHDSLHTFDNMMFEFAQARTARVIIADDIELNAAFAQIARGALLAGVVAQHEKSSLFGVLVRCPPESA